jgi:hypothetical protein
MDLSTQITCLKKASSSDGLVESAGSAGTDRVQRSGKPHLGWSIYHINSKIIFNQKFTHYNSLSIESQSHSPNYRTNMTNSSQDVRKERL